MNNDIVLFETKDGSLAMPVQVKAKTVWLNLEAEIGTGNIGIGNIGIGNTSTFPHST